MIIYKRILGFLIAFLLSGALIFVNYLPQFAWHSFILSILLLAFYFWRIKNRFISRKKLYQYFGIIFVFLISYWAVFSTINNIVFKYFISLFILFILSSIFDSIFKKIYENIEIKNQLFLYIDLFCFWFISYFLFYAQVILGLNLLILAIILVIFTIIFLIIRFYWNNISFKKELYYVLIISVIMLELFLATIFLSFSFYLSVLIIWIWYYLLMDFVIDKINNVFFWKKKLKMVILGIVIFILSILSIK